MSQSIDHRRYPRIEVDSIASVRVAAPSSNFLPEHARARNISRGGVLLETTSLFPAGTIMNIALRLAPRSTSHSLTGVVRYALDAGMRRVGVEFTAASKSFLRTVRRSIRKRERLSDSKSVASLVARELYMFGDLDIEVYEAQKKPSVADFYIFAMANKPDQLDVIAHQLNESLRRHGLCPDNVVGENETGWVMSDYKNFIVMIFDQRLRNFYRLSSDWSILPRKRWLRRFRRA